MRSAAWTVALSVAGLMCLCLPLASQSQEAKKFKPKDIPRLMAEADTFIAANDLEKAQAYLAVIVELDPKQSQAAFKLGRVCESLDEWDCVLRNYQMALGGLQGEEKAVAHAGLATGHLRADRATDAAEQAKAAIALNPSLASAHVTLADALVRLKSPEAVAAAEAATKAAPDNPVAYAALGDALMAAGKVGDAEAPLRRAIELEPKRAASHAQLATILDGKGDAEGVIAEVSTALQLDPSLRDLYALRGRAYLKKGKEDEALQDLHAAVASPTADASLHMAVAQIHHKHGRLDTAAEHYRSASEMNPQLGEAYLGLSEVLVARHDFQSAREPIERASGLLPQSAAAQYVVGLLRENQQQFDAALEAFARAIALDAKLAGAYHAQGRILRAQKKDTAGSLASLEKAAALDPENPAVLTDLGTSLYDAKQVDRTVETLQKVIASPDYQNAMGYGVLGLALKDRGELVEALGHFEKAAQLEPKWMVPRWGAAWSEFGLIKKGCPCGPEDQERVQRMKAHFDEMTTLGGKDPALAERVQALLGGQKIR